MLVTAFGEKTRHRFGINPESAVGSADDPTRKQEQALEDNRQRRRADVHQGFARAKLSFIEISAGEERDGGPS